MRLPPGAQPGGMNFSPPLPQDDPVVLSSPQNNETVYSGGAAADALVWHPNPLGSKVSPPLPMVGSAEEAVPTGSPEEEHQSDVIEVSTSPR